MRRLLPLALCAACVGAPATEPTVRTCSARLAQVDAWARYQVVDYPSGDALVSCAIQTAAGQASSVAHQSADAPARDLGLCSVVADLDEPSWGAWTFRTDGPLSHVRYDDRASGLDGVSRVFGLGECH